MKKLVLLVMAVMMAALTYAENVTKEAALKKASLLKPGKKFMPAVEGNEKGYYIFNAAEGGFVVVSGSDQMPEILGWSDQGSIDPANMPDGLKWLLESYERTARSRSMLTGSQEKKARAARKAIEPMLQTRWNQTSPYNNLCPEVNGRRCLTGCVATALAQVINYNRWPVGPTSAVEQLITQTHQLMLPRLEPTTFNWSNMTTDDIARLMLYCGQAVNMDYGVEASGAIPEQEVNALKRVFGYSRDVRFVYSSDYSSANWEELLYDELKEGRPVIYNGYTTNYEGHTFVLHGYQDGCFYVNWGWGGQGDGYFMLTNLDAGNAIYSQAHCATIGIHSSADDPVETAKAEICNLYTLDGRYFTPDNDGKTYIWVGGDVRCATSGPSTLQIGVGLYDFNDQLVKVLWEGEQSFSADETQWFTASFFIDKTTAPGSYRALPISRASASDEWEPDRGSYERYLELTVLDNLVKTRLFPLSDIEKSTVDMGIQTIDGITYDLYSVYGKRRALIVPPPTGRYKGDIRLPDDVTYEGQSYRLYQSLDAAFGDNPDITSISTSMYCAPYANNCENLVKYELREGVVQLNYPLSLPHLKSLEFPSTMNNVGEGGVYYCNELTTLRFNNPQSFTMSSYPRWFSESMPSLRDVYFLTYDPPTFSWMEGDFVVNPQVTIHIPKGSLKNWKNSHWKDWKLVEDQEPVFTGIEWGYNTHDVLDGIDVPYDLGDNDAEYAIRVPAEDLAPLKGNTISSLRFNTCYWGYDYMFITTRDKDYLVKQPLDIEANNWDWNTVALDEPFVITGEELFIGLGRHKDITTRFAAADVPSPDGFYLRGMGSGAGLDPAYLGTFISMTDDFHGNLPLRIVITGNNLPTDIQISNVEVLTDQTPIKFTARVTNRTSKIINKYTFNWTLNDIPQTSYTANSQLAGGKSEVITLELPANVKGRNQTIGYSVSNIDGKEDAIPSNSTGSVTFQLSATTFYPRRIVMEEGTGTWCGWCVRGLETISRLTKEYPDNFIAIGIHNQDEMANWLNYEGIANTFVSYPSCTINRWLWYDPEYPYIRSIVEDMKNSAEAMISASAHYARSDSSAVAVTTETTFGFSDQGEDHYRIAYVVMEDQVGPYPQKNFYDGSPVSPDDYMYPWTQQGGMVPVLFNDVARAVYSDADGLKSSIPATIEEGKAYKFTYAFNLPQNIVNRKNIRIVTLLIDTKNGEIMNAAQTAVVKSSTPDNQTFGLSYQGELQPDFASIIIEADENEHGDIVAETNPVGSGAKGLIITTLDGKQKQGKATLEIISSSLQAGQMQWCIGGDCVPMTLGKPVEKTFTTDANGQAQVLFDVAQIKSYGSLEARLTVSIGSETHQAVIQVVYEEPVMNKTSLYFREQLLYTGKRYTKADFSDIVSGSFKIAKNGRTITLTNLVTNSDMQEGCLFDFFDDVTLVLVGDNKVETQGHVAISPRRSITITGDGTLTTRSTWFDFWVDGNDFTIDNTSVTCLGFTAIGNNMMPSGDNLIVKQSTFKGKQIFRLSSMVLIGCDFDSPRKIIFDADELGGTQLKYEDGSFVDEFTIKPASGNFQYIVVPSDLGKVYLDTNKQRTVYVSCQNRGTETVRSLTYEIIINGVSQGSQTYTLPIPSNRIGEVFTLPVNFTGTAQAGIRETVIDITHVNGHPNEAPEHTASATLLTSSPVQSHRLVVEEFTGTWCGWCTRGMVGLEMLNNHFGDRVITIAAHSSDPMYCDDYGFLLGLASAYPSCIINRGPTMDPYWGSSGANKPFGIADDVEYLLSEPVVGSIEATAIWKDMAQTKIKVKTQTTFGLDINQGASSPYLIGYILVADGLKGEGSGWAQNNVYSGMGSGDSNLRGIENLPSSIYGMEYNHVGIGAWGADKGIANSVVMPLRKNQTQKFSYTCDIANNTLVQDKSKLSIVALLLDRETGVIINGAKCPIADFDPSGISTLDADEQYSYDYYDLQGRKVTASQKGLLIRQSRNADGTVSTVKVMQK